MTIGIDARFYGPLGKGLGRYVQEVVDNIIKISASDAETNRHGSVCRYVIFLSPENFDEFRSDSPDVKKVKLTCSWYGWKEQLIMPFYLWREKLDLIHFPHFNVPLFSPSPFVVTIHDLILTNFPTLKATTRHRFVYYFKNIAYRLVIFLALLRASKIITVSEFTKKDLINKFAVKEDKIIVIYEGVANLSKGRDSLFVAKLDKKEVLEHYHILDNFLLYVGNAYPHKNLEALLRSFSRLRLDRPDLRLVLVGRNDFFYEKIRRLASSLNLWQEGNANSPVVFPGYVPDAQLEILYSSARAYVFPSLYEGFGLPPLEAMAHSCPVLSSNQASLPEILGEAALYFDPTKEDDMLVKIKQILDDQNLREQLINLGRERAKRYHWWDCAQKTLAIYQSVLKGTRF